MALTNLVRKADTDFIHFPAEYGIQAENDGPALVDEVFGIVERLGNLVLTLSAAKSIRVVASEVAPYAEVVRRAKLIVVVSQDGEQILELIAGALEAGYRGLAVAVHQNEFPGSRRGSATRRQHRTGRKIAGQRHCARGARAWEAVRESGSRNQR